MGVFQEIQGLQVCDDFPLRGARILPAFAALFLMSCGAPESANRDGSSPASLSKEALYQTGHRLYATGNYDSAAVVLQRAVALDSTYGDALTELGLLHYDLAMVERSAQSKTKVKNLRQSLNYLARAEALGTSDAAVYERLCEVAVALNDDRSFLRYAKKDAERFPFDRQYYNLGLAYFNAGEYPNVVKCQKEATVKFQNSPYLGAYYRQMGRAYMKQDRDQTAQRILEAGLQAVDGLLAVEHKGKNPPADRLKRLSEDRTAILQLLRRLYQTYHVDDKLRDTERLLNEAGAMR